MDREALFKKSYGHSLPILLYGLIWFGIVLAGFLLLNLAFATAESVVFNLLMAILAAGLAGGAGGATAMISRLGRHVAIAEDFLAQSKFFYWLQPVAGVVGGLAVFVLIAVPASLLVNFIAHGQVLVTQSFSSSTFTAIYMLLAWTGGYYQQQGFLRLKAMLTKPQSAAAEPNPDTPFSFKEWYRRQQQMRRWSFTWGIFILLYGVGWIVALLLSYLQSGQSILTPKPAAAILPVVLLLAAWPTAVTGGIGGVVGMLNRLYERVSYEQNFDRQELLWYLIQPLIGTVFGTVMYFLVASGYLGLQPLFSTQSSQIVDLPPVIMLQLLLGWIAGFRQHLISDVIIRLVADVVEFFKLVLKLLNPLTLFNKTKREAVLAELGRRYEIFKPVSEGDGREDSLKWWAPD